MDTLNDNIHMQCRLCSAREGLLSLLEGKSRKIRDYLRKLVDETINIKYEANDYMDYICINCIIQIYNFYTFMIQSVKNEQKLQQVISHKSPNPHRTRKPLKNLSEIRLPMNAELTTMIRTWLYKKKDNIMESDTSECSESLASLKSTPSVHLLDKAIQTNQPRRFSCMVQTEVKHVVSHIHKETQTDKNETRKMHTQCELIKSSNSTTNNVFTQTSFKNENLSFSDIFNKQLKSNNYVHKKLKDKIVTNNFISQKHSDEKAMEMDVVTTKNRKKHEKIKNLKQIGNCFQSVPISVSQDVNINIKNRIKNNFKAKENSDNSNVQEVDTSQLKTKILISSSNESQQSHKTLDVPYNALFNKDVINDVIDNEHSKNNLSILTLSKNLLTNPDTVQTTHNLHTKETANCKKRYDENISKNCKNSSEQSSYSQVEKNVQTLLTVDCQNANFLPTEIKAEEKSPVEYISLETSLSIKSSPQFFENTYNSPPSPGLLKVTGKVQYLKSCPECGMLIYTKAEMLKHRKTHMKCYICKTQFPSIKKAKEHLNDCLKIHRSDGLQVSIIKLEDTGNFEIDYPNVASQLIYLTPKKKRRTDVSN